MKLQELLQGKEFKLDGAEYFTKFSTQEDYEDLIALSRDSLLQDFIGGWLTYYCSETEEFVYDYVTASFNGEIGSVTRCPAGTNWEDFDPDASPEVTYPLNKPQI